MESKKGDRRQDELVEDKKQEIMRILPGEIRQKVQSLSIDWEGLQHGDRKDDSNGRKKFEF